MPTKSPTVSFVWWLVLVNFPAIPLFSQISILLPTFISYHLHNIFPTLLFTSIPPPCLQFTLWLQCHFLTLICFKCKMYIHHHVYISQQSIPPPLQHAMFNNPNNQLYMQHVAFMKNGIEIGFRILYSYLAYAVDLVSYYKLQSSFWVTIQVQLYIYYTKIAGITLLGLHYNKN